MNPDEYIPFDPPGDHKIFGDRRDYYDLLTWIVDENSRRENYDMEIDDEAQDDLDRAYSKQSIKKCNATYWLNLAWDWYEEGMEETDNTSNYSNYGTWLQALTDHWNWKKKPDYST